MLIDVLRVKATRQWCGPANGSDELPPLDSESVTRWRDAVAKTLGLVADDLEVIRFEGEFLPDGTIDRDPRGDPAKWIHDPNIEDLTASSAPVVLKPTLENLLAQAKDFEDFKKLVNS